MRKKINLSKSINKLEFQVMEACIEDPTISVKKLKLIVDYFQINYLTMSQPSLIKSKKRKKKLMILKIRVDVHRTEYCKVSANSPHPI